MTRRCGVATFEVLKVKLSSREGNRNKRFWEVFIRLPDGKEVVRRGVKDRGGSIWFFLNKKKFRTWGGERRQTMKSPGGNSLKLAE